MIYEEISVHHTKFNSISVSNGLLAFMIFAVPLAIWPQCILYVQANLVSCQLLFLSNFCTISLLDTRSIDINCRTDFIFPLVLNTMHFVLSILRDNQLAFSHLITLLSLLFITVDNSCKLLARQNNVVSFGNKIGKESIGHRCYIVYA